MRTSKFLPGIVLLILAFQTIFTQPLFAQNQPSLQDKLVGPLPELLRSEEGAIIETAGQWEQIRRGELLELFREHMYGRVPETPVSIRYHLKYCDDNALNGSATMKEVEMEVIRDSDTLDIALLIFLPSDRQGPVPLFLGLNFNGNQSIHPNQQISLTESWVLNNKDLEITDL